MADRTFVLYLDGREVTRGAWLDLVRYIHRNHCYSFQHACDHEGYSWQEANQDNAQEEA